MDGGQLTAVLIVALVVLGSIIRTVLRGGRSHNPRGLVAPDSQARAENQRLRDELVQLKERLKVLERITVEKENSLSNEIESLRDR
jgi:hypothetical protein